ncbi:MAG TPA: amidohydrolase [Dehalococcoidia bacterium]|nr:amidohydrolase [Dehalococcoidia bacterium]
MPYGNIDWLALTPEDTIEPDLPICDPHHHFWDFRSVRIPYQRYLLHELSEDINSGHNVTSTVFIETTSMYRTTGPVELRSVGEVEFVQGLAAASASGLYGPAKAAAAIVGKADLNLGERVEPVLEALQSASPNRFRGIRYACGWDKHDSVENRAKEEQLLDPVFQEGAKILAKKGMTLDNTVYFPQLPELARFANAVPDLKIISNHIGGLLRVGPYGNRDNEVIEEWKKNIDQLASCPNVYMKLGGLGQPRYGFDWHTRDAPIDSNSLAADLSPLLSYCIEKFGPDRCMFECNFPPDKVSYSFNVLYNAFKILSKDYSKSERALMFHDTAVKVYNINE